MSCSKKGREKDEDLTCLAKKEEAQPTACGGDKMALDLLLQRPSEKVFSIFAYSSIYLLLSFFFFFLVCPLTVGVAFLT